MPRIIREATPQYLERLQTAARDYASEVAGEYDPDEDGEEIAYLEATIAAWERELADGCKGSMWMGMAGYTNPLVDLADLDAFERPEFLYTAFTKWRKYCALRSATRKGAANANEQRGDP